MPGFDGTGPSGKGPMTGNGKGFCILKVDKKESDKIEGYIGLQGKEYSKEIGDPESVKEKVSGSDTNIYGFLKKGGDFMPRGDGTGPNGLGPMTGRGAGLCAGYSVPGFANPINRRGGLGRGFGFFGRGRGRGFRNRYYSPGFTGLGGAYYPNDPYIQPAVTAEQEAEILKNQAKLMQDNLNALNQRIQELENLETRKEKPK